MHFKELNFTANLPTPRNTPQSPSFKPSFFVILLQLVPLYGRREGKEGRTGGGREERVLASVGKFANLMQQNVRASEERRNSVSIDCYGRISLKKVGSGVLERISDIQCIPRYIKHTGRSDRGSKW